MEFITSRPALQEIFKRSSVKRKMIQVRNLDLHKETKITGEEIKERAKKSFIFLILI